MNINAVIFDMDGLLLDSEKIAIDFFHQACKKFNLGNQTDLYMKILGTNTAETISVLEAEFSDKPVNVNDFMDDWFSAYQTRTENKPVPLMPGVASLLKYLQSESIAAAVATSTARDLAIRKLTNSGIIDYFETITGGDQVENSKPAPEIYLKAAASIHQEPQNCLALEDSPNGVRSAHSAGMQVIQIPDLLQPDDHLLSLGHVVLKNLDKVQESLSKNRLRGHTKN